MTKLTSGPSTQVLFQPLTIGPKTARSRVFMPPHSSAIGNLWGTEDEAEQALAYLRQRAEAGIAWSTIPGRISNVLNTGFEPSGISAVIEGPFRGFGYVERVRRYVDTMHDAGALAATQLTMNGGYPHAPSSRFAQPVNFLAPHAITTREIDRLLEEYRFSAAKAREAGIDIIELHMNHEDLTQQFLSPLTNDRVDRYGGSFQNRLRFPLEVLRAIRDAAGDDIAVGVRMNVAEADSRGFGVDEGIGIAQAIEATSLVDCFHMVYGTTWGNPSYIQPHFFLPGQWSPLARRYREALSVPVFYSGLVDSAQRAAEIVAGGDADMVGMARAHIADGDLLAKARRGDAADVRPCVGVNDCINRRYVDGLGFGCAVNPHTSREREGRWGSGKRITRPLVVVGGGPAGLELAGLAAEAGASVTLYERSDVLGGQLRTASKAPSFGRYADYLSWQARRISRAGVDVRIGVDFGADDMAALADGSTVAFATGATERRPPIEGLEAAGAVRGWDILEGRRELGGSRVAVIVQDDHMAPLAVAERLAVDGAAVTLFYSTHIPAQLLGRYIVGSAMGRLDALGVRIRIMEEVVQVGSRDLGVRNVYSGRAERVGPFDAVVTACGGESDAALFAKAEKESRLDVHILGDAYAPRRLVFATRQALAIAELLSDREREAVSPR